MKKVKEIQFTRSSENELSRWFVTDADLHAVAKELKVTHRTLMRWRQRINDGERVSDLWTIGRVARLIKLQNRDVERPARHTLKTGSKPQEIVSVLNTMGYHIITDDLNRSKVSSEDDKGNEIDDTADTETDNSVAAKGIVRQEQDDNVSMEDNDVRVAESEAGSGETDVMPEDSGVEAADGYVELNAKSVNRSDEGYQRMSDAVMPDNANSVGFDYQKPEYNVIQFINVINEEGDQRVTFVRVKNLTELDYQTLVTYMHDRSIEILTSEVAYQGLLGQAVEQQQNMLNIQGKMSHEI
ncbi:hypothetical protein ABC426_00750 [Lactiplantibacillus plantarum]|uniref:hypothetical protein n=1 Tax=Lactiplantibacillus plantarum TaxID=1590 RepID=UPI001BAC534F|nr:hypothetical protein [Lactiplantibacillus plantarum]MBS0953509.1 hypothetical protein [Lactiplantibacillus plantarum]